MTFISWIALEGSSVLVQSKWSKPKTWAFNILNLYIFQIDEGVHCYNLEVLSSNDIIDKKKYCAN